MLALDSPYVLLASALGVALLGLLVLVITLRKSTSQGNAILLLGPAFSGKTSILSSASMPYSISFLTLIVVQLVYGHNLPTHASYQTNVALYNQPNSKVPLRLVDIPGHPRIRGQFQDHLKEAKAIVFTVDASTISRTGPAVAEHLHVIMNGLTSLPPSQKLPTLLVLANKTDLLKTSSSIGDVDALAINRVKTILERELEKRRAAQSSGIAVEGLGEEGESTEMGGLECVGTAKTFRFADWEGGEVEFLSSSAKASSEKETSGEKMLEPVGLESLKDWISSL